jgi:hypothetical protein
MDGEGYAVMWWYAVRMVRQVVLTLAFILSAAHLAAVPVGVKHPNVTMIVVFSLMWVIFTTIQNDEDAAKKNR